MEKPIVRQWRLLHQLSTVPDGMSLDALAEVLNVSGRTINRDLSTLKASGFPLLEQTGKRGVKQWGFDGDQIGNPPRFSYDEAAALYIGRRFLEPMMGTFLWEAAHSALRKIRQHLGPRAVQYLERMLGTIRNTTFGWSDYSEKSDILDTLLLGCEERRQVTILYQSAEATESSRYAICPYQLIYHNGSLYVIGFSCKRNEIRHWKVDRISGATVMDIPFEIPADFNTEDYQQTMFGIYHSTESNRVTVRVRFAPSVARYVQEQRWHVSQHSTIEKDGSVVVEFSVAETPEIKHWILSFGQCAVVLEPESLRQAVFEEVKKLYSVYG